MRAIRTGAAAAMLSLMTLAAAWAGSGAGIVNDVTGTALGGYDAVSYFDPAGPVQGIPKFTATYQGLPYLFRSAEHRDAFLADPAHYAPQYGGFCAVAAAYGDKATIDPSAYKLVAGKLYVVHSRKALDMFEKDPDGLIIKADTNWPKVHTIDGPSH
jgi:YHS domain-containing protein